ncbi:hypothetical protein [Marinoscillum sp. MHG1-6]|uniref:hypothetical protein n=1 Tax=Marinoscillum sp. MHG1-6 TaxID=2959627 RepID=UPI0021574B70|nr:hypothetical protein [Marinoscillum sp. MHG1-6]
MRGLFIVIFSLIISISYAQERHFRESDQKLMVHHGEMVKIDTDTAFVISSSRAQLLNEKLDELVEMRLTNLELQVINQSLLEKVKEVEVLVSKLIVRMEDDATQTSIAFDDIVAQLDTSLVTLGNNNEELHRNNLELESQIQQMEHTIKKLKRNIRGIWWNGVTDKLVAGGIGFGLGVLLMVL